MNGSLTNISANLCQANPLEEINLSIMCGILKNGPQNRKCCWPSAEKLQIVLTVGPQSAPQELELNRNTHDASNHVPEPSQSFLVCVAAEPRLCLRLCTKPDTLIVCQALCGAASLRLKACDQKRQPERLLTSPSCASPLRLPAWVVTFICIYI